MNQTLSSELNAQIFEQFWKWHSNSLQFAQNKSNICYDYLKRFNQTRQASLLAHQATLNVLNQQENDPILVSATNDNEIEFEINENVLEFYRKSRKFRREKQQEEKQRLKAINEGRDVDYVSGEQVKMEVEHATRDAPLERAGSKREEELKALYGPRANMIQLSETKLKMKYDRNLDVYQPKYWPSFPLKLKFN